VKYKFIFSLIIEEYKMGKKSTRRTKSYPLVSICTPTFNRRPFFPYLIKCIEAQDYPKEKIEWIIIDDGTDKIGDLVKDLPYVKYHSFDEKMLLGKKRNLMHEKSLGEILVYMDDDDYYPPQRISHAVDTLTKNPKALCAGSSELYLYFKHIEKIYKFGPYGPNHGTAGTFAFRRQLLKHTSYQDTAALAEEKHFLKNYSIPFVQLDPMKTILVFSHPHNTFDKRELLENGTNDYVKETTKTVDEFIKDNDVRDFYMNRIDGILRDYEPGDIKNKPDVIKQTQEIREKREQMKEEIALQEQKTQMTSIIMTTGDGVSRQLSVFDCAQIIKQQQQHIKDLRNAVQQLQGNCQELQGSCQQLQEHSENLKKYIQHLQNQIQQMNVINV
jgi:glycosyltransferase involved in cell wall biosynthesis